MSFVLDGSVALAWLLPGTSAAQRLPHPAVPLLP
jgi:hypothetical protein